MRIIIEIDDKTVFKTGFKQSAGEDYRQAAADEVTGQINATPPVELQRIADALGAESAGAAPAALISTVSDNLVRKPGIYTETSVKDTDEIDKAEAVDAGGPPDE